MGDTAHLVTPLSRGPTTSAVATQATFSVNDTVDAPILPTATPTYTLVPPTHTPTYTPGYPPATFANGAKRDGCVKADRTVHIYKTNTTNPVLRMMLKAT